MKIRNATRYPTRVLRSLILAAIADVESLGVRGERCPIQTTRERAQRIRQVCRVSFVYTRGDQDRGCSGNAAYSGARMTLRAPRGSVLLTELLHVIRHEVYHLFGATHAEMPPAVMHRSDAATALILERFGRIWFVTPDERLEEAAKPAPIVTSLDEKRAAKVDALTARIERWEAKRKRAETALKKLTKSRRYYERAIAQAAKERGGQ